MTPATESSIRAFLAELLAPFGEVDEAAGSAVRAAPATALWDVATPRFRSKLGGPEHLADLLGNPAWGPLVGHRSVDIAGVHVIDDAARAEATVTAGDGTTVRYLVSLVRSPATGDGEGGTPTWRVSGLVRAELSDL